MRFRLVIRHEVSLSKKKAEVDYQNETIVSLIESIDNTALPGSANHAILNGNHIGLAAIAGPRLEIKMRPGGSPVNRNVVNGQRGIGSANFRSRLYLQEIRAMSGSYHRTFTVWFDQNSGLLVDRKPRAAPSTSRPAPGAQEIPESAPCGHALRSDCQ